MISVILPTLNAARYAEPLGRALASQTRALDEFIVVDSSSDDGTRVAFEAVGARVLTIRREAFNHGAVRNLAAAEARGRFLLFLTQDALPEDRRWLTNLVGPLERGEAQASFARQVPRPNATPLERYARRVNYPQESHIVTADDMERLGIRSVFFSNASSAVLASAFRSLGGFRTDVIMNEDMLFASALLRSGGAIAYAADALVQHSHAFTPRKTFQRYFDIGVVLDQARADLGTLSRGRAGYSYAMGLARTLILEGAYPWLAAGALETCMKLAGVTLGRRHRYLPLALTRSLSMHKTFWNDAAAETTA